MALKGLFWLLVITILYCYLILFAMLTTLSGMCFEPYGMAMEFIPHGNLYDWLRNEGQDGGKLLGWEMRFRIAMYPFLYAALNSS